MLITEIFQKYQDVEISYGIMFTLNFAQLNQVISITVVSLSDAGKGVMVGWTDRRLLLPSKVAVVCAIAQAVSCRLPSEAVLVRAWVSVMWDLWWTKWHGGRFLRVLRFPLPILIQLIAAQSSSIIWDWHNRPKSSRITKWTQSDPMRKKDVAVIL
jgi:hypothetical protein